MDIVNMLRFTAEDDREYIVPQAIAYEYMTCSTVKCSGILCVDCINGAENKEQRAEFIKFKG